ncbi:hypothetical protein [Streptomyces colonosanans]|uniref:hypothetical protein n=1 Tax=Streptomyces colonosanans TaxID=1428652 RepID=UPI00115FEF12|nr:hypothetical protein [Streptomyces colonosanans]
MLVQQVSGGQVRARSKKIGFGADGSCGSVTYGDMVVRGEQGWCIGRSEVTARRLSGADRRPE